MTIGKPVSTLLSDYIFVEAWHPLREKPPKISGGTGIASAKRVVQHVLNGINTGKGYSFLFVYHDDVLMFSDANNIVGCSETVN